MHKGTSQPVVTGRYGASRVCKRPVRQRKLMAASIDANTGDNTVLVKYLSQSNKKKEI